MPHVPSYRCIHAPPARLNLDLNLTRSTVKHVAASLEPRSLNLSAGRSFYTSCDPTFRWYFACCHLRLRQAVSSLANSNSRPPGTKRDHQPSSDSRPPSLGKASCFSGQRPFFSRFLTEPTSVRYRKSQLHAQGLYPKSYETDAWMREHLDFCSRFVVFLVSRRIK